MKLEKEQNLLSPYPYLSKVQRLKTFFREKALTLYKEKKVGLIIGGAQKAGTSGLFSTLTNHPELTRPIALKELHYFSNTKWYTQSKLNQYHSFFPVPSKQLRSTIYFESTPNYLYQKEVAIRLKQYNPNLKLIFILRDPTERAFSSWKMHHFAFAKRKSNQFYDQRTFSKAIEEELNKQNTLKGYLNKGLYAKHLKFYLNEFEKEQMLILDSNSLLNEPHQLKRIYNFIGIENMNLQLTIGNKSGAYIKTEEDKQTLLKLKQFYRVGNEELFDLLEQNFNW